VVIHPTSFSCPLCHAPLRAGDGALLGQTVACPDCRGQIRIVSDGHKGLTACKTDDADAAKHSDSRSTEVTGFARTRPVAETTSSTSSDGRQSRGLGAESTPRPLQILKEPVVVAWTVAIGLALTLMAIIWTSHEERRGEASTNLLAQQPLKESTSDGVSIPVNDRGSVRGRDTPAAQTAEGLNIGIGVPDEPGAQQDVRSDRPGEGVHTSPSDIRKSDAATQASQPARQPRRPRAPALPFAVDPGRLEHDPARIPAVIGEPATKIDAAVALAQRIRSYEQTRGATLRIMLRELEEMLGVPVRLNDPLLRDVDSLLDRPVKVKKMENITVEEILRSVLNSVGLRYEIDADGIQLRRGDSP